MRSFPFAFALTLAILAPTWARAQALEEQLLGEAPAALAADAQKSGDAERGAIVFHQAYMACVKCHAPENGREGVGPNLATLKPRPDDAALVDSVLRPSQAIRRGYETVTVATIEGRVLQGLLAGKSDQEVRIRDASKDFEVVAIATDQIDELVQGKRSLMPSGQVNSLTSRQQFLDLMKYLFEIRDGGPERAKALQPPPALYASAALPEYESRIDHAGMLRDLDDKAAKRGEEIYLRVCANCHGTQDRPGSLPTSLKFATGKFKNGADPYAMYQTITRGFGQMTPQTWMVPRQKYDVVHYIRESYLKPDNPSQYFEIDDQYLSSLPKGDTRGPEPRDFRPWRDMNYGPNLVATYEIGDAGENFAHKGNAVRLDPGPGGISRGRAWMVFDYDTLRVAAGWSGAEFIDYNGINFNGRHGIHPRVAGEVQFANPTGPGWAEPGTESFADTRLVGRDERRYGPLPRKWAQYRGMYYHGPETIVSYTVGETPVLESHARAESAPEVFVRQFEIGPRSKDLVLQVVHDPDGGGLALWKTPPSASRTLRNVVALGASEEQRGDSANAPLPHGAGFYQTGAADRLNLVAGDFTIAARIKTNQDGVIFAKTAAEPKWVPGGHAFFIRGGRLHYDIGWVGVVRSNVRVADNRWHDVAVCYEAESHQFRFTVDGQSAGGGRLEPEERKPGHVVRIGFAAPDFPKPSQFTGQIARVLFLKEAVAGERIPALDPDVAAPKSCQADWGLGGVTEEVVENRVADSLHARAVRGDAAAQAANGMLLAGLASAEPESVAGLDWTLVDGNLRLRIPAGSERLRFALWLTRRDNAEAAAETLSRLTFRKPSRDLTALTQGGPDRWPNVVRTTAKIGESNGPFAVDELTYPLANPWLCRMRLTGHDFYSDPDRAAVCDWDGNVWLVTGLAALDRGTETAPQLTWKRIASGLFQPLGLRVLDDVVHVTCRDQICRLHDLNGDEAIDYVECVNNDHQVTEHFHEFAMGLQTDAEGNFYYAKSARHALKAVVPHHGTLLKVSRDGQRTEILATGFRAANGVCLNPDGTYIVTDQEGHWNPKNRINWVSRGKFYGNMYGYHDVTDESDDAMEPPLCWITNSFDRSPAELLWVDSPKWGPLHQRLLNISYGYGKVFLVPHERVDGQVQGGMIELPIPQFPTGTIRGRFHPRDGQLYLTGMFAWAGSRQAPGGFYRLRYTGAPVHLPVELNATKEGIELEFTGELDRESAEDVDNYEITVWDLKRTKNYGSKHYHERPLKVTAARVAGRRVKLSVEKIAPTWCMEIRYEIRDPSGKPVSGVIHNTIHALR